ncbi:hypothetical protein SAMN04487759_1262 [Kandleria vitulina]|uniref:Histidine kinase-, DNA gyrase B-, and HSP90-like ATPase n=1 Tax=Kandleria vitulina TaxID=1630 RepID=A0A1H2UZG2_9FIRM|nr:hypothetical protein [Kandleria vitulina]SDW61049.1 hypothetical protein SAMN04487759_1262 [Kandleria vitulina]
MSMKIEIHSNEKMSQSGSSLLKLIQNDDMPNLDLVVRESIQNSLDARKTDANFVNIKFNINEFVAERLNNELEDVTAALNRKYTEQKYKFLSIRDSNTVGLTGEQNFYNLTDDNHGNVTKLIYEICEPQQNEGAGGSWGIGKTVYFRLGTAGLVIYYSRIKLPNGEFQSRLAVTLVEDESKPDSVVPAYGNVNSRKRGIAWWGQSIGENATCPINDEEYIKSFLSIFGLAPYENDETGTMIIIPYIDEKKLLDHNYRSHKKNNEDVRVTWLNSLEEALEVSIQRWYAPRLFNPYYQFGCYLKAYVNDKAISVDKMRPVFRVVQSLYNHAIEKIGMMDLLDEKGVNVNVEQINYNRVDGNAIATIAYCKVDKELLRMTPPDNDYDPYVYINKAPYAEDKNTPILCMLRKPGMIVAYETESDWTKGVPETYLDEFLFCVVVLKSESKLKNYDMTVEEYIRQSEHADHTKWTDHDIKNATSKYKLVYNLVTKTRKALKKAYTVTEKHESGRMNTNLGLKFAKALLPTIGSGNLPSTKHKKETSSGHHPKIRNAKLKVGEVLKYDRNEIVIPVSFSLPKKSKRYVAGLTIATEQGSIKLKDWYEKYQLDYPFYIKKVQIVSIKNNSERPLSIQMSVDNLFNEVDVKDLKFKLEKSNKGPAVTFEIDKDSDDVDVVVETRFTMHIDKRDLEPELVKYEEEGHK